MCTGRSRSARGDRDAKRVRPRHLGDDLWHGARARTPAGLQSSTIRRPTLNSIASLTWLQGYTLNLSTAGINDPKVATERFLAAAARVKSRNWHIQLNTTLPVSAAMKDAFAASPVTLVSDHYGNVKEELGVGQPCFTDLVNLVKSGKAYVKISVTAGPRENYGYFTPLAQMLISSNVDRILWGTNWPHPNSVDGSTSKVTPLWQVDDGLVFNLLPAWAPEAAVRKKILVDNPARLYEF